jgi:hypothetical protein
MNGMIRSVVRLLIVGFAASTWADCQDVRILKQFDRVPETCEFDGCEIWKSGSVLGKGEWHNGVTFANLRWVDVQPFEIPEQAYYGTSTDNFVAKNGDVMYAQNVQVGRVGVPINGGLMFVNGGTGRFANVTGTLFIRVDNPRGKAWVNGELCGLPDEYNDFESDPEED